MKRIFFAILLSIAFVFSIAAAPDTFDAHFEQLSVPADNADAVTYDAEAANASRAVFVGSAGDLAVYMKGSTTVRVFKGLSAGQFLPIRVDQIRGSGDGTTIPAADILILY